MAPKNGHKSSKCPMFMFLAVLLLYSHQVVSICIPFFLLEHAIIMGIHKLMHGENMIFPHSSHGPPKGHTYLKCPLFMFLIVF